MMAFDNFEDLINIFAEWFYIRFSYEKIVVHADVFPIFFYVIFAFQKKLGFFLPIFQVVYQLYKF